MRGKDAFLSEVNLDQQFQMNTNLIGHSIKESSNEGAIGLIREESLPVDDFFDRVNTNDQINIETSMKKMADGLGLDDNPMLDDQQLDIDFEEPDINNVQELHNEILSFDSNLPVFDKKDFDLREIDDNIQELMALTPKKLKQIEEKVHDTRKRIKPNNVDQNLETKMERAKENLMQVEEMKQTDNKFLRQLIGSLKKEELSEEKKRRKSDIEAKEVLEQARNDEGKLSSYTECGEHKRDL